MSSERDVHDRLAKAHALRDQHQHLAAIAALGAADADDEPRLASARAMLAYECWLPATELLERALELSPGDRQLTRNLAGSYAADGDFRRGEELLVAALRKDPAWIEGQIALARVRSTFAIGEADRGFRDAAKILPGVASLWISWFQWLAKARSWDAARAVLDQGQAHCPGNRPMALSRFFLDAESGASRDPGLFDSVSDLKDPGIDLGRVRHALRLTRPELVEPIAMSHLSKPAGRMFWPYLSLAWRLLGDKRTSWLEGGSDAVRAHDLGYDQNELGELATFVRSLHLTSAPQVDQSVRSGTQTERSVLLHHDSRITDLRTRIAEAVDRHVAALPPAVAGHPWLCVRRDGWRFSGSWSVRLRPGGHHVPHTHPDGWFSSALHLSLPSARSDNGALLFGQPPPDLGLDLTATRSVRPKAGILQLFPSTAWHSTSPIKAGERLTVAFDIAAV